MLTAVDIGSLIERTPNICGGRPRIAETGTSVRRIAQWNILGYGPEEIVARIGHITLAQVHAALSYYYSNREEINQDLAADEALEAELARKAEAGIPL